MSSIKEITKDLSLLRDATHLSVVDLEKQICVLHEEVLHPWKFKMGQKLLK